MLLQLQHELGMQDQIKSLLNDWPAQLLPATLAIGFLTMTIISYYKPYIRIPFHRRALNEWLKLSPEILEQSISWADRFNHREVRENDDFQYYANFDAKGGIDTLLDLTIAGDEYALYCLNVPSLSGQLALGTQTLLDNPNRYPVLLAELIGKEIAKTDMRDDYTTALFGMFVPPIVNQDTNYRPEKSDMQTYARNRISAHIQRRIDSFQVGTAYLWRNKMRATALTTAMTLSLFGSMLFAKSGHFFGIIVISLAIGYLGAFLAGLFHDLISVLKSHKR